MKKRHRDENSKKRNGKNVKNVPEYSSWVKHLAEMFSEVQKQKEYARHNPPMEKRTTRFICRVGRGAHAFDPEVSARLSSRAVPLFWQLAFIEAVNAIVSIHEDVTISYADAVKERGNALKADKVLFSRGCSRHVKALLPKAVHALTGVYEAFRADEWRYDRNVRYASNEYRFSLSTYGFRRTACVLVLSMRRKGMA